MGRLRDKILGDLQQPRGYAIQLTFTKGLLGGFIAGAILVSTVTYVSQVVTENRQLRTAVMKQRQPQAPTYTPASLILPPPFEETPYSRGMPESGI